MCFSASASFGAGVVLTVVGVVTIKKTHNDTKWLFAAIPFFFGVQQLAEGVLWLALPHPEYLNIQKIFTHIFVFFAQVLWPIWVPLAILLLEKKGTRKNIQKALVAIGVLTGISLAYCLMNYTVEAKIVGNHIAYFQDYPSSLKIVGILLYLMATLLPPFFSHTKHMWMFGTAILLSYIITAIFYDHYILSVWCFFSSIISIYIYIIMRDLSWHNDENL